MPDLEVGDVVWFDRDETINKDLGARWGEYEPLVILAYNGLHHYFVRPLYEWPKNYHGAKRISFLSHRFRKDEFLTAAKKACAGEAKDE